MREESHNPEHDSTADNARDAPKQKFESADSATNHDVL